MVLWWCGDGGGRDGIVSVMPVWWPQIVLKYKYGDALVAIWCHCGSVVAVVL